jgi:hypothetical protein
MPGSLHLHKKLDIQISVRQSAEVQEIDITQRSCATFHRTLLGVDESLAGIYKTEYTYIVTKGQAMSQLISAQSITRYEAWTAYRIIYLPSMRYSLPATSFTQLDLGNYPTQSYSSFFAMRSNRNIPLAVDDALGGR